MKRTLLGSLTLGLAAAFAFEAAARLAPADRPLAHMVFFTLKDHSQEAREKFVASCEKYLNDHEGTIYFSVGVLAEDSEEPGVSVKDFDVALHAVFASKEAKDKYLVNPRHVKFVEENRESFAKVRVFDSYLKPAAK